MYLGSFENEENASTAYKKALEQRMYNEEDFKVFARQYYRSIKEDSSNRLWTDLADEAFEQFKKK